MSTSWDEKKHDIFGLVSVILIAIPFLHFVLTRTGWQDDRMTLYTATRVANGDVPYKDFVLGVMPGSPHVIGAVFSIFGVAVYYDRLVLLVFDVVSIGLFFVIARHFLPVVWAWMATILTLPLTYAHFHYNQSHYNWYGLTFQLLVVVLLLHDRLRLDRRQMVIAGIVSFLSFFMMQRSGMIIVAATMTVIVMRNFVRNEKRMNIVIDLLLYGGAWWACMGIYLGYLAVNHVSPALLYRQTFGVLPQFAGMMFGLPNPFADWLAMAIYLFAILEVLVVCRIACLFLMKRPIDEKMTILFVMSVFIFLGMFPTIGFHHLIYVIHLSILLLVVYGYRFVVNLGYGRIPYYLFFVVMALVTIGGGYRVIACSSSSWNASPGGIFDGVHVTAQQAEDLRAVRQYVNSKVGGEDPVLALPFEGHMNIWCGRREYYDLPVITRASDPQYDLSVRGQISANPPKMILYNDSNDIGTTLGTTFELFQRCYPQTFAFIEERYRQVDHVCSYRVFLRNEGNGK